MYVIEKMRLNRFEYVKIPTRRQLYDQMNRAGLIRTQSFADGRESDDPYSTPVNTLDGKSKIDVATEAANMFEQDLAMKQNTSNK